MLAVIMVRRETGDVGYHLEWLLRGLEKSYENIFQNRNFKNLRKGMLKNVSGIDETSRFREIWQRKFTQHFVALFFPNPLQGFSIYAQREQMKDLPQGFYLSGAIEPMIMYPDVMARSQYTTHFDLSAMIHYGVNQNSTPIFWPHNDAFHHGFRESAHHSYGEYSGSLLFYRE